MPRPRCPGAFILVSACCLILIGMLVLTILKPPPPPPTCPTQQCLLDSVDGVVPIDPQYMVIVFDDGTVFVREERTK